MNRNEEYRALLQELEPTPPALDTAVERALKRHRAARKRRLWGIPVGSLAACFALFVGLRRACRRLHGFLGLHGINHRWNRGNRR